MKIIIGSDHAGFGYKRELIAQLRSRDITVVDVGTDSEAPVPSSPFVREVARGVLSGDYTFGIVLSATGNGAAMAANRFKGIRCAVCWDVDTAKLARSQQDANLLALGERVIDLRTAIATVDAFLATPFAGGWHQEMVRLLDE